MVAGAAEKQAGRKWPMMIILEVFGGGNLRKQATESGESWQGCAGAGLRFPSAEAKAEHTYQIRLDLIDMI